MTARTGEQFLKGLRGPRGLGRRELRISDVVGRSQLTGAAHALAEGLRSPITSIADILLMPDEETGEPIPVSHMIPRSRDDLLRRGRRCAASRYSVGLMGRTPDYMTSPMPVSPAKRGEWANHGNEAGAERLVAYQKFLRRGASRYPHHRAADRRQDDGRCAQAGNSYALRKVADPSTGIVVRGARILADPFAAFADEIRVYPALPLPAGGRRLCPSFCIPMSAPGLKFLCADSAFGRRPTASIHPCRALRRAGRLRDLRRRRIPARSLFIDCNLAAYNSVMATSGRPTSSSRR